MPAQTLRVLCVHGVNTPETSTAWQDDWRTAIRDGVHRWSPDLNVRIDFVAYNDLFQARELTATEYFDALRKLVASGISTAIAGLLPKSRAFGGVTQAVRWTAGMVVQWVEDQGLRADTRKRVKTAVENRNPDVILAHSLGSLLCYDTFVRDPGRAAVRERTFVSFGSQIGNPFVRNSFGGRLNGLEARFWYHLFNRHDLETFTWPIRLSDSNFAQIAADFDLAGILDHDAARYLSHPGMTDTVWREILAAPAGGRPRARALRPGAPPPRASAVRPPRTERRALLVGINDYPDPADRLEGCVNDVFLMSSLLQECGFDAEDIRVVLDKRATAKGILDRLDWLLEDAREKDQRVLFYSGHGAQLPAYAPNEKVDHKDECLVPYDFDWSPERAVTDDQFFDLYSQLPYGVNFIVAFDCCHSGGMTRDGRARVRGLTPPDDIRHRDLRWNAAHEMWVDRAFVPMNRSLHASEVGAEFLGESGAKSRLGRAAVLRRLENVDYDRVRRELGHYGPYMPLILQACGEKELASEYRHGATSHGAFTFCLAKILRNSRKKGVNLAFEELVLRVRKELKALNYDQTPQVVGPRGSRDAMVPWTQPSSGPQAPKRRTRPAPQRKRVRRRGT